MLACRVRAAVSRSCAHVTSFESLINSLCLWIVCRQCYIMITVSVFHSTVAFKATVVIVRVYKKIEKRFTYGVTNGHVPCTLVDA